MSGVLRTVDKVSAYFNLTMIEMMKGESTAVPARRLGRSVRVKGGKGRRRAEYLG